MFWLLLFTAIASAARADDPSTGVAVIPAKRKPPKRALPERMPKPEAGLKVWGDYPDDDATWVPTYMKSLGVKDFRWGMCLPDLIEELQRDPRVPSWVGNIDEVVYAVANVVSAGAGKVAQWLMDRVCLRFKWPLRAFETLEGERLWTVDTGEAPIQATGFAPPHPLPARPGYKRVWVRDFDGGFAARTRNETALEVYWPELPEHSGPVVKELVNTAELRGMLRMAYDVTGAITAGDLAGVAEGRSRFWFARRKEAMPEFK